MESIKKEKALVLQGLFLFYPSGGLPDKPIYETIDFIEFEQKLYKELTV